MASLKCTFALLVSVLMAGCATPERPRGDADTIDFSKSSGKACNVWIYRNHTLFKSIGFEVDMPLASVDEKVVGRLVAGRSYCLSLTPGPHRLAVKFEGGLLGRDQVLSHRFDVPADKPLFIRYAIENRGLQGSGSRSYEVENSTFREVPEQAWRERE